MGLSMSDTKLKQLRREIDELNELLQQAKHKNVQDLLSSKIGKLETEWINLKDIEAASGVAGDDGAATAAPAACSSTRSKRYRNLDRSSYNKVVVILAKARPNVMWLYINATEKRLANHYTTRYGDLSKMSKAKALYETIKMKRMISKAWYEDQ